MQDTEPMRKRPRMAYTASAAAETEADEACQQLPDAFLAYYSAQRLCSRSAWEETLRLLRRPQLLSVRVNQTVAGRGGVDAALAPLRCLLHDSLKPVPWLPAAFIVQDHDLQVVPCADVLEVPPPPPAAVEADAGAGGEAGVERKRKYTLEQAVQHALIMGMKSGELAQQEVTSMVPAVLLAPEPQHAVLDMCAAPGSKTTQLLDMMGDDPPGLLLCNERDASRMHKLAARMQRQPCAPVLVTCGEAQVRAQLPWPSYRAQLPRATLALTPCAPHALTRHTGYSHGAPPALAPPPRPPAASLRAEATGAAGDDEPRRRPHAGLPQAQV